MIIKPVQIEYGDERFAGPEDSIDYFGVYVDDSKSPLNWLAAFSAENDAVDYLKMMENKHVD